MSLISRVFIALLGVVFLVSEGPSAYRTAKSLFVEATDAWRQDDEVTSPERVEELAAKGQREQIISFRDALREVAAGGNAQYYALGVGQVTLKTPENIPSAKVQVTGSRQPQKNLTTSSPVSVVAECDSYPSYGEFNNILLFDKKKDEFVTVFDKRLSVSSFQAGCRTSRPIIWFRVFEADTDGDGTLGLGDETALYVFALDDRTLHRIALEHMRVESVWSIPDVGYLLVQCRVDRNKDGEFDYGYGTDEEEPTTIMRVDLKTFVATPFVPAEVAANLQQILEGRGVAATTGK